MVAGSKVGVIARVLVAVGSGVCVTVAVRLGVTATFVCVAIVGGLLGTLATD